ncbi:MAG: hypothetical protein WDW38_009005 [Sanguina aurantia]
MQQKEPPLTPSSTQTFASPHVNEAVTGPPPTAGSGAGSPPDLRMQHTNASPHTADTPHTGFPHRVMSHTQHAPSSSTGSCSTHPSSRTDSSSCAPPQPVQHPSCSVSAAGTHPPGRSLSAGSGISEPGTPVPAGCVLVHPLLVSSSSSSLPHPDSTSQAAQSEASAGNGSVHGGGCKGRGRRYASTPGPQSGSSAQLGSCLPSVGSVAQGRQQQRYHPQAPANHGLPLASGSLGSGSMWDGHGDTQEMQARSGDHVVDASPPCCYPGPDTGSHTALARSIPVPHVSASRNILPVAGPRFAVTLGSHSAAANSPPIARLLHTAATAAAGVAGAAGAAAAAAAAVPSHIGVQPLYTQPTMVVTIHVRTHRSLAAVAAAALEAQIAAPALCVPAAVTLAASHTHTMAFNHTPSGTSTSQPHTLTPRLDLSPPRPTQHSAVATRPLPPPLHSHRSDVSPPNPPPPPPPQLFDDPPTLRVNPPTAVPSGPEVAVAGASPPADPAPGEDGSWPSCVAPSPQPGTLSERHPGQRIPTDPECVDHISSPPCSSLHRTLNAMLRKRQPSHPSHQDGSTATTNDDNSSSRHVAHFSHLPSRPKQGKEGRGAPTREMEGVLQASDSRAAGAPRSAQLPAAGRVGTGREGGDDSRTKGGAVAEAAAPSSSRRAAANAELREVLLMTCQALQASRGGRGARPGWALMMGQRTGAFEACMSRERLGGRTRCSGRSASGAQQHAEDSDLAVTTPCLHSWAAPTMCPVQLKGSHPIQPSSIPHPSAAPALLPVGPKLCPDGVATESWGGLHNTAGVIPSGREDTPGAEMRKRQGAMAGCGPGEHVGRRGRV